MTGVQSTRTGAVVRTRQLVSLEQRTSTVQLPVTSASARGSADQPSASAPVGSRNRYSSTPVQSVAVEPDASSTTTPSQALPPTRTGSIWQSGGGTPLNAKTYCVAHQVSPAATETAVPRVAPQ
jgi:hypothetical protein